MTVLIRLQWIARLLVTFFVNSFHILSFNLTFISFIATNLLLHSNWIWSVLNNSLRNNWPAPMMRIQVNETGQIASLSVNRKTEETQQPRGLEVRVPLSSLSYRSPSRPLAPDRRFPFSRSSSVAQCIIDNWMCSLIAKMTWHLLVKLSWNFEELITMLIQHNESPSQSMSEESLSKMIVYAPQLNWWNGDSDDSIKSHSIERG